MNVRILLKRGEEGASVEGIPWYHSFGFGGEITRKVIFQIETEDGWEDVPVVEEEECLK